MEKDPSSNSLITLKNGEIEKKVRNLISRGLQDANLSQYISLERLKQLGLDLLHQDYEIRKNAAKQIASLGLEVRWHKQALKSLLLPLVTNINEQRDAGDSTLLPLFADYEQEFEDVFNKALESLVGHFEGITEVISWYFENSDLEQKLDIVAWIDDHWVANNKYEEMIIWLFKNGEHQRKIQTIYLFIRHNIGSARILIDNTIEQAEDIKLQVGLHAAKAYFEGDIEPFIKFITTNFSDPTLALLTNDESEIYPGYIEDCAGYLIALNNSIDIFKIQYNDLDTKSIVERFASSNIESAIVGKVYKVVGLTLYDECQLGDCIEALNIALELKVVDWELLKCLEKAYINSNTIIETLNAFYKLCIANSCDKQILRFLCDLHLKYDYFKSKQEQIDKAKESHSLPLVILEEYSQDGVYSNSCIYVGKSALDIFKKIKGYIPQAMDNHITNHIDELMWNLEPKLIRESFNCPNFENDDFGFNEINQICVYLCDLHLQRLLENAATTVCGEWVEYVDYLYASWDEENDYYRISFEGDIASFVLFLIEVEERRFMRGQYFSTERVKWLNTVREIIADNMWWNDKEKYKAMLNLFDEFNEMNS